MKVALFYHSFGSCWNHGNAHFLRGVVRELLAAGHEVSVWEPADGWSRSNQLADGGGAAMTEAERLTPGVELYSYDGGALDLDRAVGGADLVLVHEWTDPVIVAALGRRRARGSRFTLLFHDTHHRAVTARDDMEALELDAYDAVLAFGEVLRDAYEERGWGRRAYTWHEAADTALFQPMTAPKTCDLIWVGNWGDGERSRELKTLLIEPAARLDLNTRIHGVRYPEPARAALLRHGIDYKGWLPNHRVPAAFASARMTVHIPRGPYAKTLPGIPTIRMFEALACGIPLVSAPWSDVEGLFPPGSYLRARTGEEMATAMTALLNEPAMATELADAGLRAIQGAHTCWHRVAQLEAILRSLRQTTEQETISPIELQRMPL
jgi:spore maturation protein CgeB